MKTPTFALAASLLALQTVAAEPPLDGEESVRIEFVVTSASPEGLAHRGDPVSARIEFVGVSHTEAGGAMFDNLAVRCAGTSDLTEDRGDCVATARDGDTLLLSYRYPDEAGRTSAIIAGGTGKFTGLSGRSQGANATIPAGPGLPLFVSRQMVRWRGGAPARPRAASRF